MNIFERVKGKLPEDYDLVAIQRKSNHPMDKHLFLVEGNNRVTGDYAVWEYSDATNDLFSGEYRLTKALANENLANRTEDVYKQFETKDECDKVFEKTYGAKPFANFEVETTKFVERTDIERGVAI